MLKLRTVTQVIVTCVAMVAAVLGATSVSVASDAADVADTADTAQARDACWVLLEVRPGVFSYVNVCAGPDEEQNDGDGGGGGEDNGPRCDLTQEPYDEFCLGVRACRADIPSPVDEEKWPEETRPSPDHIFTSVQCLVPGEDGTWNRFRWIIPYEEALPGLGWQAFGRLETPAFVLSFDPDGMTYVGVDTQFSVDGIGDGEIIGGTAGPLHATGTLSHIEIDPGDSSGAFDCDPYLRSRVCEHTYMEMSHGHSAEDLDGRPSFPAQARLIYDVVFTMGGIEVALPGVPETLESPWNGTLVPVGEIQALIR